MKRNSLQHLITLLMLVLVAPSVWAQTDMTQWLNQLKKRVAPDKRTALWNVTSIDQDGIPTLCGSVSTQDLKDAIDDALKADGITAVNNVTVMEKAIPADRRWGIVRLSVITLREEARHGSSFATQALMGMPIKLLEDAGGGWYRVQMPDDYIAYIPKSSLAYKTADQMAAWRKARRMVVTAQFSQVLEKAATDALPVCDLVLNNIVEVASQQGKWTQVILPDGRTGYVPSSDLVDINKWANQPFDASVIELTARRMLGHGYLWGGTSTKDVDCSGLIKTAYLANGIILQRDASQQALTGGIMSDTPWQQYQRGDLLFFSERPDKRVTHVGLYMSDGNFIHCSGEVKINSLDPAAPKYYQDSKHVSATRINGYIGTRGIVQAAKHPWYF